MKRKLEIADEKMIVSGWGDLDGNLLRRIFELLTSEHLFHSVISVCHWWRSVCVDMLFWKDDEFLDLSYLKLLLGNEVNYLKLLLGNEVNTPDYAKKLLMALQSVMDGSAAEHSQRCIRSIRFPRAMPFHDEHLEFICQRSPKLKKLILPGPVGVRATDLTEVMQKWGEHEELVMGPFRNGNIDDFIPAFGRSCKNLSVLSLSSSGSDLAPCRFMLGEVNLL